MKKTLTLVLAACGLAASAQTSPIEYYVQAYGNGSTGDMAPTMLGSLNHGRNAQRGAALLEAAVSRRIDTSTRFSWGFGADFIGGYSTSTSYARWNATDQVWGTNSWRPAAARVQQLYGEVKFRGVFLTVGMKEHGSALLNNALSSGDLVESGNARPIPEVRAGFIDFQNIPFTNGWVQIQGEISYGKMMDKGFLDAQFNHYYWHVNKGSIYTYKRCYFRTKPTERFSGTIGMQAGGFFGGTSTFYRDGKHYATETYSRGIKSFIKMFLPIGENGEEYYTGSTLGSWDLHLRYRLNNNDELIAYVEKPWEDGSGIGLRSRADGVWGIEYKRAGGGYINGVVFEYVDFRDQGGAIHWAPGDHPGTGILDESTGKDDYYNNAFYNSYANYGQAIGTPFMPSPIYNRNGFPGFDCNRINGFHIGLSGDALGEFDYRVLFSYRRGMGRYDYPYARVREGVSFMAEAGWDARAILPGLSARVQVGFDAGRLAGKNFGTSLSVTYSGKIFTRK